MSTNINKTLVIECGGGFGNRMQNFINGFYFRDKYNFTKTYLTWRYQWGWMSYYKDILSLSPEYELIDESELGYPPCFGSGIVYPLGSNEQDFKIVTPTDSTFREEEMNQLSSVVLRESDIYSKIPLDERYRIAKEYFPNPSTQLSEKINLFMNSAGLETDKYLGVHIRKTDKLGQGPSEEYYISEIRRFLEKEGSKIFLCSDDPKTERKIMNMFPQNVSVRKKSPNSDAVPFIGDFKNSHSNRIRFSKEIDDKLEQMIPRSGSNPPEWWVKERDPLSANPRMIYNTYRNRLHTVEAVMDFFVLSRSSRILKSVGTFSTVASIINSSRKL